MGSGTSSLSKEQSIQLTKELKERYEEYKKDSCLTEEELQLKITHEYERIVEKIVKGNHHDKTAAAKTDHNESAGINLTKVAKNKSGVSSRRANVDENLHKQTTPSKNTTKSSAPTPTNRGNARRRSFDNGAAAKKLAASNHNTAETNQAEATPSALPTTDLSAAPHAEISVAPTPTETTVSVSQSTEHAAGDSWDSVTHQPYCNICQMAFKSETFLQRHIKYSDLHQNNVKKLEGNAAPPPIIPPTTNPDGTLCNPALLNSLGSSKKLLPLVSKQVEGQHFKLLYTGSKFFWRSQDNIDLHFYHHILPHTLEIIPYDSTKGKELPRIYLDYTVLADNVTKHHKTSTGEDLVEDEAQRTAITTFILQRLQLNTNLSHLIAHSNTMQSASTNQLPTAASLSSTILLEFVKLTGDDGFLTPILEKPPVVLIPVVLTRRRRTNAEEIDATINSLAADRSALAEATGKAETIANLVYHSASEISSKKWWSNFSRPRKLWVWAIRRVIRQKLVAETKKNWAQRALKKDSMKKSKRNSMAEEKVSK